MQKLFIAAFLGQVLLTTATATGSSTSNQPATPATVTAGEGEEGRKAVVTVSEGKQWVRLRNYKDIVAGSALDFSSQHLQEAPAGKYGWLKAVGGSFEFEKRPGQACRFYGVNLCFTANYPTHPADADFGYITTYAPSSAGNPNLKWETSEQTNVGVDARFLKNRLSFTMDWFRKNTKDLIVTGAALSYITGLTESPINAGDIRNEGFEFELGWQDQIGKDFHYGIRANLSTLKNEVTYIHPSLTSGMDGATFHVNGAVTRFEVDHPAWYFYGYKFKGINSETGNPEFYDVNGDGQIGPEDKTEIGKGMASMNFGITLNAAWKGIDFIMFGSGAVGNDIYCLINRADYPTNRLTEFTNDRWTESNRNGSKPRAGATDYDKYLMSDAVVYDGSYFKIKQIQLGYSLPKAWLSKVFISNMRIYGSLEDYFTFTKYPGFDPETTGTGSSMGLDKGVFPTSKKLVFGASITF